MLPDRYKQETGFLFIRSSYVRTIFLIAIMADLIGVQKLPGYHRKAAFWIIDTYCFLIKKIQTIPLPSFVIRSPLPVLSVPSQHASQEKYT